MLFLNKKKTKEVEFNPSGLIKQDNWMLPNELRRMVKLLPNTYGLLETIGGLKRQLAPICEKFPLNTDMSKCRNGNTSEVLYLSWIYTLIVLAEEIVRYNGGFNDIRLEELISNCKTVSMVTGKGTTIKGLLNILRDNYPNLYKKFLEVVTYSNKEMVLTSIPMVIEGKTFNDLVHPVSGGGGYVILNSIRGTLTTNNVVVPYTAKYIINTFGSRFDVSLSWDNDEFIYTIDSLDAPSDFTETKEQREKDFLAYLDTLAPMNLEAMMDKIKDDEVTRFICDNEPYVSKIYAPYKFPENTYVRRLSDGYKRLEDTNKLVPHDSGLSPDVVDTIFKGYEGWEAVHYYTGIWRVNYVSSDDYLYPEMNTVMWVINSDSRVYINNLYLIKKAIAVEKIKKEYSDTIKKYHLTHNGVNMLIDRLLHGKGYVLDVYGNENIDSIYIYNPQEHIVTDTPEKLCLKHEFRTTVRMGETVLLKHSDTGTITKHPINSVEDIDKLKEFGIVRED